MSLERQQVVAQSQRPSPLAPRGRPFQQVEDDNCEIG